MAEGRYYWLKLKRDFFKRHDIVIIESMPNGKDYILFYLKLLCESVDNSGRLRFSDKVPYNEDMLATITRTNVDIVRSAIKLFSELGMMEILDDGTFYMSEVERLIGSESSSANAIRQKRFRENRKSELSAAPVVTDGVTENNASVTNSNANRYASVTKNNESKSKSKSKSIDIDIEREKEPDKKRASASQISEEFNFSHSVREAFGRYLSYLSETGKPAGTESARALAKKLKSIAHDDVEAVEILETAIRKRWKDIYAPDRPKNQSPAVRSFGDYEQRKTNYSEIEKMMYAADDKGEDSDEDERRSVF